MKLSVLYSINVRMATLFTIQVKPNLPFREVAKKVLLLMAGQLRPLMARILIECGFPYLYTLLKILEISFFGTLLTNFL